VPGGNAIPRAVGIILANLLVKREKIGRGTIAHGAAAAVLASRITAGITTIRALAREQRIWIALGAGAPARKHDVGVLIIPMPLLASTILRV